MIFEFSTRIVNEKRRLPEPEWWMLYELDRSIGEHLSLKYPRDLRTGHSKCQTYVIVLFLLWFGFRLSIV